MLVKIGVRASYAALNRGVYEMGSDEAKVSMLRLKIGSGMLRLSSCMLSIGRGAQAIEGREGGGHTLPPSH